MTTTLFDDMTITTVVDRAACTGTDPAIFFSDDMTVVQQAKQVCAACPVQAECLAAARQRCEPHGVWGGELFADGIVIERKRPRGRPRKHPLPDPAPAVHAVEVGVPQPAPLRPVRVERAA